MIKVFAGNKRSDWIAMILLFGTGTASAQWWGTNAPPCSNGHCAPVTPFGYQATRWHQWPGAVYPDMARPTPAGEEIPPSRVDVPPQKRELEIQTPSTQAPARSSEPPESNEQLPAPATQPAPGLQGLPLRPTEEPSEPSFREVPGGGGGGPSFQQSPFTPPQGGSSSSLKNRVRGVASEGFAAAGDMRGSQAARPQTAERKDAATVTIANTAAGRSYMTRISTPDQEPELFLPSLAARPLAGEPRGQAVWSGNPLRGDATAPAAADRGAMPAVALDVNRGDSERTELGSITPSGSRANPLR